MFCFAQKPKAGTGTFSLSRSDLHVKVTVERTGRVLLARCERRNGLSFEIELGLSTRRLRVVRGILPTLHLQSAEDRATAKLRQVTWYDAVDGAPATWRQASTTTGRRKPERGWQSGCTRG